MLAADKCTEFENNARGTKNKAVGIGDTYSRSQLSSLLNIDKCLIGEKMYICKLYELDEGESELQWSLGARTASVTK